MKTAIVLWTGGKDSCLALHLAREQGFNIEGLVTFVPAGESEFKAHPQTEIKLQAKRLNLEINFLEIREPYKESYIEQLNWIKTHFKTDIVVTGDIDSVAGFPNWIVECCTEAKIEVYMPLWKKPREWIMEQLLSRKIQARMSLINHAAIPSNWMGRIIDRELLEELKRLCRNHEIDLAGENGEYHTMVIHTPSMTYF